MVGSAGIKVNIKKVNLRGVKVLQPEFYEELGVNLADIYSEKVLRAIKYRAPKGVISGGNLKKSIKRDRKTNSKTRTIYSNARYFNAINSGFKGHWIPADYITQTHENPNVQPQELASKEDVMATGGYIYSRSVPSHVGFAERGIRAGLKNLKNSMKRALKKTL